MKRVFVILSAFATLVACSKVTPIVDDPMQEENQEIKVNFTISREDANTDTKASVKTAFSEDDVVFVFFNGVDAPKHLEMKRTGDSWTPITGGELKALDLVDGGTLTAIYLPYGSGITVDGSGNTFTFSESYTGYYYVASTTYGFENNTVTANITLAVAPPDSGSDVIVHFDVSGLSSTHEYNMYQEYVKPLTLTAISKTGTVTQTVGTAGNAILGHQDDGFVSFSGVLDASAVGAENKKIYQFFVRDETLGTLYYRTTASAKTITVNTYIGLGSAATSPTSPWAVASPGAFSVSDTKKVTIARSNLAYYGASYPDHPWQLMKYPWSTLFQSSQKVCSASGLLATDDTDHFGWGTSGWNSQKGHWTYYQPWSTSTRPQDGAALDVNNFYGFGPDTNDPYPDLTGENSQGDWGVYNTIYSFGAGSSYVPAYWRTPTNDDWAYIINTRTCEYRYVKATVNGMGGVVIFPDNFTLPDGVSIVDKNVGTTLFDDNNLNAITWNKLEAKGVVFLPANGIFAYSSRTPGGDFSIENNPHLVIYWTSTHIDKYKSYALYCGDGKKDAFNKGCVNNMYACDDAQRKTGLSVRFVHDID